MLAACVDTTTTGLPQVSIVPAPQQSWESDGGSK